MRSKCRDDLKWLSNERAGLRDASSSTRLLDFAEVHEQTFDVLWSEFALFPSATRIGEGFHGIERNAYNEQTPHDWRDARGRYLAFNEYENRRKRRREVHERAGKEGKKLKRAARHRDRSYLVAMIGNQLEETAKTRYTKEALAKRFNPDILLANKVSAQREKGTTTQQKALTAEKVEIANKQSRENRKKWGVPALDDYLVRATARISTRDADWNSRDETAASKKLTCILTKTFWNKLKMAKLHDEIERVCPCFWALLQNEMSGLSNKEKQKLMRKGSILNSKEGTHRTSLVLFFKLVIQISTGKEENTLSTPDRLAELTAANVTGEALVREFVKADNSQEMAERETEVKHVSMKGVIASTGTEISGHDRWKREILDIPRRTTNYIAPTTPATDDEDDDFNGAGGAFDSPSAAQGGD